MPPYRKFFSYLLFEHVPGLKPKFIYVGEGQERWVGGVQLGYSRLKTYRLLHRVRNGALRQRATELAALGGQLVPKLIKYFPSKLEAGEHERRIVAKCFAKGVPIINRKEGGAFGGNFTPAVLAHLRKVHTGVRHTAATKAKLSHLFLGKNKSVAHVEAIRIAKTGIHCDAQTKCKIATTLKKRRHHYLWNLTDAEKAELESWSGRVIQASGNGYILTRAEKRHVKKMRLGLPTAKARPGFQQSISVPASAATLEALRLPTAT